MSGLLDVLEPGELSQFSAALDEFMAETGPYEGFENKTAMDIARDIYCEPNTWMADDIHPAIMAWGRARGPLLVFMADMCVNPLQYESQRAHGRALVKVLRRLRAAGCDSCGALSA